MQSQLPSDWFAFRFLENFLCEKRHKWVMREIVNSIKAAQPQAKLSNSHIKSFKNKRLVYNGAYDNALKMLQINRQQFKVLFDNLPHGLCLHKVIYDEGGRPVDYVLVECNQTYCNVNSYKREGVVRPTEFIEEKKDKPINWTTLYGRVGATGKPELFEAYCKPSGKWYTICVYSPKEGFVVSIFLDTTKEKNATVKTLVSGRQAIQELLITEKRYRRLFETTQDGIMARDLEGRMIDCNPAYAKMLGYSKKELRKLLVEQLLPERWHEQRKRLVKKVLQTGRSVVFEREYKRKDGTVFPASVRTWRLTDGKGKAIGIWSIVRDITEQKVQQRNLEENARALEKIIDDRTKQLKDSERLIAIGQTAGMVGHDLRNPLQTITGELYLAKDEVQSLADSPQKKSLQESISVIEEQAAYMDKIVSDLQAFVRPVKVDKKPIDLKTLVEGVLLSVNSPPNILVQTQMDNGFSEVKADPRLLRRVLTNLVTNAIQAMPNGGELSVKSRVNSQGHIALTVKDTGVGIEESIKHQIFTPLFTTKSRGQGFGLAVCKRVIEAHGGSITFESTQGKGTEFTIELPAA